MLINTPNKVNPWSLEFTQNNRVASHVLVSIQIYTLYGKCSKNSNTFRFLLLKEMLVMRAGIHKMHVRIANREDRQIRTHTMNLYYI